MSKKRILLTGATGYLGSYMLRKLANQKGYEVFAVVPEVPNLQQLTGLMENVTGKKAMVSYLHQKPSQFMVADIGRMQNLLEVQPAVLLQEGLQQMFGSYP